MTPISRIMIIAAAFLVLFPSLRAADSQPVLPTGNPLATLALPGELGSSNISLAVSKALLEAEWENLGWDGSVTTATIKKSRVNIKVFALTGAADVKLYAQYSSENKLSEDKCRQIALRELRTLEETISEKLSLSFHKAKGQDPIDRASAD